MNEIEKNIRNKNKAIKFDLKGEKKGKPIRIWGKIYNQFNISGHWLRGNFHCHLRKDRWGGRFSKSVKFLSKARV